MKMKRSETLQRAIGTAREEWGTGETARVRRHQAHVTAPKEGTMELENSNDRREKEPGEGHDPESRHAMCEETVRAKREQESETTPALTREREKRTTDGDVEQGNE